MSNSIATIRSDLTKMQPQFAAALPKHVTPEKFIRTVMTALQADPNLLKADKQSLFASCTKAAADGLVLDGREAALVMFSDKVQYMPMVAGIIKRARNSGQISTVSAHVIYENDDFEFALGDDEHIRHVPRLSNRGSAIGAYAIVKLNDGGIQRSVMNREEIEVVRAVSRAGKSQYGPWVKFWDQMAEKTVLRRALKRAPYSTDLESVLHADDNFYSVQDQPRTVVTDLHKHQSETRSDALIEKLEGDQDLETTAVIEDGK